MNSSPRQAMAGNDGKKVVAVIPARMSASRFPGKPLAGLLGIPMIEHVYRRTAMSRAVNEVYVATCDREVYDAVEGFGGKAIMTSPAHERASERVAEAARSIEADVYVMVQGDEPMVMPDMLDLAIEPMRREPAVVCVNLAARIGTLEEFRDPNTIKVVIGGDWNALYFSRQPIPTVSLIPFERIIAYKQVCIIPFTRDFLAKYAELPTTALERAESIDMLRVLEHGYSVRMVETPFTTFAVDTPEDLARVEAALRDDPLVATYA